MPSLDRATWDVRVKSRGSNGGELRLTEASVARSSSIARLPNSPSSRIVSRPVPVVMPTMCEVMVRSGESRTRPSARAARGRPPPVECLERCTERLLHGQVPLVLRCAPPAPPLPSFLSGSAAHLVAPDPATSPFWGALMSAISRLCPAAPWLPVPSRSAGLRGTPAHDTSLQVRLRAADPPQRYVLRGCVPAPTTASLRATPDPHLIADNRRRHVLIDLVVRRAERGSETGSVAPPRRRLTVSQ